MPVQDLFSLRGRYGFMECRMPKICLDPANTSDKTYNGS